MKKRAIVPAFVAVSLMYAVCVSNVPAVELLSRMTSKLGKAEAKCGAAVQKSAKQKSAKHASLKDLLSHFTGAVQPKQKSAKQKSAKSAGHVRNLLDRVVRRAEPKCGCEVQGKKASAAKHHDDATPPPAPEVSNEA